MTQTNGDNNNPTDDFDFIDDEVRDNNFGGSQEAFLNNPMLTRIAETVQRDPQAAIDKVVQVVDAVQRSKKAGFVLALGGAAALSLGALVIGRNSKRNKDD